VSLAAGLAMRGKRVLLVDTDAQGNVGVSLRVKSERTLYHVLVMGLSGKDGNLITARKLVAGAADLGFVGEVTAIKPDVINTLDRDQFIPVIAPIGRDDEGNTYNINADDVAAAVATALGADKLVLLTDVPGILLDPKDAGSLLSTLRVREIEDMIARGVITGGMQPKVRACERALNGGVGKTHIIDGRVPHALLLEIFTDQGIGTEMAV